MARQLYDQTKKATMESKFKGKEGSLEDYKDRANIMGKAIYEVGKEASGIAQFQRDQDFYAKQNKEYYKTHSVSAGMKYIDSMAASAKAGGILLANRNPVVAGYNMADGASKALAGYAFDKSDAATMREAEKNYSKTALHRARATERLATSDFYKGMYESMLLQREQDAIANGGYPADSSKARAIAKFLATANEPKLLLDKYEDTSKLQRMITGEMNDLRQAMYARREDGGLYDPSYYEGIRNRVDRLNRAMDVTKTMAASLRAEEKTGPDWQKSGTKNSFKLLKSEFKAMNHELDGMQYRLKGTLYDATKQKDKEILQQRKADLEVSKTFVEGISQSINGFFSGVSKMLGGDGDPSAAGQANGTSPVDPLASVNQLKNALFNSASDAIGGDMDGDGIKLDVPSPQDLTDQRNDIAQNTENKNANFENKARKLAIKDNMDYQKIVAKVELAKRDKARARKELQRRRQRQRQARIDQALRAQRDLKVKRQAALSNAVRAQYEKEHEQRLRDRARKEQERKDQDASRIITWDEHFCSTAVTDRTRAAWERSSGKKCKKIKVSSKDKTEPKYGSTKPVEDDCLPGQLCDSLPPELQQIDNDDKCKDPAYRASRQGVYCVKTDELAHVGGD